MFTVTMYILGLLINFGFNGMWGLVCVLQTCCVGRGVYNYHFVPPPEGGKMSGSWGRKRPWRGWEMKGEDKEGEKEKGKRNDE